MATAIKTLTNKNLARLFDVSGMSIYNWQNGAILSKTEFPVLATPSAVRRWAARNGVEMTCDPVKLLGSDVLKPGPKPKQRAAARSKAWDARSVLRNVNPSRAGSFGKAASLKNSKRAAR